jgi:hypothetical protein
MAVMWKINIWLSRLSYILASYIYTYKMTYGDRQTDTDTTGYITRDTLEICNAIKS